MAPRAGGLLSTWSQVRFLPGAPHPVPADNPMRISGRIAGEARARSPSPILLTATDISPRADLVSLLRRERTRRGPAGGQRQGCGGQDREQRRKHDDRVRVVIRREGGAPRGAGPPENPPAAPRGQPKPRAPAPPAE